MRMAIWSATLAVFPIFCSGMNASQAAPDPTAQLPQQALTAAAESKTSQPVPVAAGPAATVDNSKYVLGPDDQIVVNVWGDTRLTSPLLVRPDGRIAINLAGEILAAGRTPDQLSHDIEELLKSKEILTHPNVTVNVTSVQSKRYMLNGAVNKPGSEALTKPTTVMEALVNAGGFKDFADKKHIQIIRGEKRFTFNWNDVVKGKNLKQNIVLEPGDIIIVKD